MHWCSADLSSKRQKLISKVVKRRTWLSCKFWKPWKAAVSKLAWPASLEKGSPKKHHSLKKAQPRRNLPNPASLQRLQHLLRKKKKTKDLLGTCCGRSNCGNMSWTAESTCQSAWPWMVTLFLRSSSTRVTTIWWTVSSASTWMTSSLQERAWAAKKTHESIMVNQLALLSDSMSSCIASSLAVSTTATNKRFVDVRWHNPWTVPESPSTRRNTSTKSSPSTSRRPERHSAAQRESNSKETEPATWLVGCLSMACQPNAASLGRFCVTGTSHFFECNCGLTLGMPKRPPTSTWSSEATDALTRSGLGSTAMPPGVPDQMGLHREAGSLSWRLGRRSVATSPSPSRRANWPELAQCWTTNFGCCHRQLGVDQDCLRHADLACPPTWQRGDDALAGRFSVHHWSSRSLWRQQQQGPWHEIGWETNSHRDQNGVWAHDCSWRSSQMNSHQQLADGVAKVSARQYDFEGTASKKVKQNVRQDEQDSLDRAAQEFHANGEGWYLDWRDGIRRKNGVQHLSLRRLWPAHWRGQTFLLKAPLPCFTAQAAEGEFGQQPPSDLLHDFRLWDCPCGRFWLQGRDGPQLWQGALRSSFSSCPGVCVYPGKACWRSRSTSLHDSVGTYWGAPTEWEAHMGWNHWDRGGWDTCITISGNKGRNRLPTALSRRDRISDGQGLWSLVWRLRQLASTWLCREHQHEHRRLHATVWDRQAFARRRL